MTAPVPLPSNVPPPPGLPAGTRLGRYEVVSELGTGGMATVYLGRALSVAGFQRLVAIKVLHPHLLRDTQFVEMFLDEGRLAARIHHPNVVGTLDLEHTEHGVWIVSEYIEGDILLGLYKNARAQEKRIPFPVTFRIALDALAGLHAAHELADDLGNPLKLIHRDVSPHNILVGSDGIARILDFGIAKAEERISSTRDGIVKGKLSYMAPEQPNDQPIDRRVDVFSAATVIWECLTGRRLFPGKTDGEVLQALLHKPITRAREVDPTLPVALDEVLAKALSRDPDGRYASAADFADALEAAAQPIGVANARTVAQYVKEIAAAKITAEHERRRMTTRDLPVFRGTPSQVRALDRGSVPPPGPVAPADRPVGSTSSPSMSSVSAEAAAAVAAVSAVSAAAPSEPPSPIKATSNPALPVFKGPAAPPPPSDAKVSTPPLEGPELPASTIPALLAPPGETLPALVPAPDEAPTQLQSLEAVRSREVTPSEPLTTMGTHRVAVAPPPFAGREKTAPPPLPGATPSSPRPALPPLPTMGVRTAVMASVPPPPPNSAEQGNKTTVMASVPPPGPNESANRTAVMASVPPPPPTSTEVVKAEAPPPPPGFEGVSKTSSTDATVVTAHDTAPTARDLAPPAAAALEVAETERDLAGPAAMAQVEPPAATLSPAALAVLDDESAPTLLAITAPPGAKPVSRPAPAPAVDAKAALPEPAFKSDPLAPAKRPAAAPQVDERGGRWRLVAIVVVLGVMLGYGVWYATNLPSTVVAMQPPANVEVPAVTPAPTPNEPELPPMAAPTANPPPSAEATAPTTAPAAPSAPEAPATAQPAPTPVAAPGEAVAARREPSASPRRPAAVVQPRAQPTPTPAPTAPAAPVIAPTVAPAAPSLPTSI
ncbi:MAG: protein kinase [Myxococcales bacterium]|nr:protein kinase [Myxococcales bacterium]